MSSLESFCCVNWSMTNDSSIIPDSDRHIPRRRHPTSGPRSFPRKRVAPFFLKLENPWAASGQGVAWFAQPQLFHWNGKQFFFSIRPLDPCASNSTTTPWVVKFFTGISRNAEPWIGVESEPVRLADDRGENVEVLTLLKLLALAMKNCSFWWKKKINSFRPWRNRIVGGSR